MNPTLHAQILTIKKYQAWRTGEDTRTMGEAGIVSAAITSALDAVIAIAENHLRDGMKKAEPVNHAIRIYNSGYMAGHQDTVEGCFTDILSADMATYHEDVVSELVDDLRGRQPAEPVGVQIEEIIESVKAYGRAYSMSNTTASELHIRIQDIRALLSKYATPQPKQLGEPDYLISACYFPGHDEVELTWERKSDGEKAALTCRVTPEQGRQIANTVWPCVYHTAAPQPQQQAGELVKYQRLTGWSKNGVESLCVSLDIQQEQSGGGSKACAVAASLLRGIAEQHFAAPEPEEKP